MRTQEERVAEIRLIQKKKKNDYYLLNKGRIAERSKEHYHNRFDKNKRYFANRKRRGRISAIDELKPGEWAKVVQDCENTCIVEGCGTSPVTMDHVISLFRGGRHHISNLQPICNSCNASKGINTVDYRRD